MSSEELDLQLSYDIHEALSTVLHDEESPGILNRWILMAETLFEGGSSVAYITSPNLSNWEVLGMVQATKVIAENNLLAGYEDEED